MDTTLDNASLYGSPTGYSQVIAHYDRTLDRMGVPFKSTYVPTRYGATHIVACGKEAGKPVVLWHGQNANVTTWARWIPFLAGTYHVFAVDVIGGLGKSAPTRPERKGATYGEWAADVLAGLELPPANMIGVSNGGWLVLKLSGVAPERIASAVLLSSAGFMPIRMKLVLQIVAASLGRNPKRIAERLVALLSPPNMPADPFYTEFFELILTSKFRGEQIAPRLGDYEFGRLTAPTSVLMGQYETSFNPYKAIERALTLLPNVVVAEIVPGVGHSMEHKQPQWVMSRVTSFLDAHGA